MTSKATTSSWQLREESNWLTLVMIFERGNLAAPIFSLKCAVIDKWLFFLWVIFWKCQQHCLWRQTQAQDKSFNPHFSPMLTITSFNSWTVALARSYYCSFKLHYLILCILKESCYGKWLWVTPRHVYVPCVMEMKWTHADKNLSYIIWNDYSPLLLLLGRLPH